MIAFQLIATRMRDALQAASLVEMTSKGRLRPMPQEVASQIVVRFDRATGNLGSISDGPTDWDAAFALDVYLRVSDDSDPEDQAGDILSQAYQVVRTMDASGLGITNLLGAPEVVATPSEVDADLVCLTLFLTVQHRTGANNLNPME